MQWRPSTWKKSLNAFFLVISLAVVFISIRDYRKPRENRKGVLHSEINNYLIFSNSFEVLASGGDLYNYHPKEHFDLYKYSPAFAFFMAPFHFMPEWLGLTVWNLLNFALLFFALKWIPGMDSRRVLIVLLIGVLELLGSIMNEQSNGLMVGMVVLAFALFERDRSFWAIAVLMASFYTKLFTGIFIGLVIFYPGFWKNALYTFFWFLFFAFIPVLLTGWDQLSFLYQSWAFLLLNDHGMSQGYSLMGILQTWFGWEADKLLVVAGGLLLTLLPLVRISLYESFRYRMEFTASLLLWVIVFNHKSESPTFIIAMTGIGLWYVHSARTGFRTALLVFAMLFVSIAFSDLTPKYIREAVFYKYSLKALPCLIIWMVMVYEMLTARFANEVIEN